MNKIVIIISTLIGALVMHLIDRVIFAKKDSKEHRTEIKQIIIELNNNNKRALKATKDSYEVKLKEKDEIISDFYQTIDRLISTLKKDKSRGTNRVMKTVLKSKEKLDNLGDNI